MKIKNTGREILPAEFEKRYGSEKLKERIADYGMWCAIPSVTGSMNSAFGIRRLRENQLLFDFIDQYFPDIPYAFEPNMRDGRFVFLPDNVSHQGIGVLVSKVFPGSLDFCHFWYPCEYTDKKKIASGQVCIPAFALKPGTECANLIRRLYTDEEASKNVCCTFAFNPDYVVKLRGHFLDDLDATETAVLTALKDADESVCGQGEKLVSFMRWIMEK